MYIASSKLNALSPDGRCKTFDISADGYARAEGCGVLVIKRLSDAIANGDRVLAVIRGTAVNHGGRASSLTAPSGTAQEVVIREALRAAGLESSAISYVEAHGTGTPLGDPIEIGALSQVYGKGRDKNPIIIGSVKTNIGHTESAAGVAGLIKVILSMRNKTIPKNLHFHTLNPNIAPLETLGAKIPTENLAWQPINGRRIAGISSFGISGTNSHVILEEAPAETPSARPGPPERTTHIFCVSAMKDEALREMAGKYSAFLHKNATASLPDVCFTSTFGRSHFEKRLALTAATTEELAKKLDDFVSGAEITSGMYRGTLAAGARAPKIAFLFTGQGSQYLGMGKELYDTHPVFKKAIDRCEEILLRYGKTALKEILFKEGSSLIDQTEHTQPALFALEYALAELWKSFGIEPYAVLGHSVGEYVAATVAGVFSLEDGLKMIFHRGRLMQALPGHGEMAAIVASEQDVLKAIQGELSTVAIAAINGPQSVVIAGESKALRRIVDQFDAQGVRVILLNVSHAFHSPQMDPMLGEFETIAAGITYNKPKIRMISNLTGKRVEEAEVCSAKYWRDHVRGSVRFYEGMQALEAEEIDVHLEVGPGTTLLGMGQLCFPGEKAQQFIWESSLKRGVKDWQRMAETIAGLYVHGAKLNWQGWEVGFPKRHRVELPTYAFQKKRYWVEATVESKTVQLRGIVGERTDSALNPREHIFELELNSASLAYIKDHQVYGVPIVPGAGFVEMALTAASRLENIDLSRSCIAMKNLEIKMALAIDPSNSKRVQVVLERAETAEKSYRFQIYSRMEKSPWVEHASGEVSVLEDREKVSQEMPLELIRARLAGAPETGEGLYTRLHQMGLHYGPDFQGLRQVWRGDLESLALVELPDSLATDFGNYLLHPAQLDACFQAIFFCSTNKSQESNAFLPVSIDEVRYFTTSSKKLWVHSTIRVEKSGDRRMWNATLRLLNEAGQLVAEVRGLNALESPGDVVLNAIRPKSRIEEWLYEPKWEEQVATLSAVTLQRTAASWLIFADRGGIGEMLAKEVEAKGDQAILVDFDNSLKDIQVAELRCLVNARSPDHYVRLLQEIKFAYPLKQVVHLWSLNCLDVDQALDLASDQWMSYGSGLSLTQAMLKSDVAKAAKIGFITRGAQMVVPDSDRLSAEQATTWGLGKVIEREHSELECMKIDLDGTSLFLRPKYLQSQIKHLLGDLEGVRQERQVAYRNKTNESLVRYVARLERHSPKTSSLTPLNGEKTYLITGGLGGLGLQIAKHLAEKEGVRNLALMGRSGPGDKAKKIIKDLEAAGAKVCVYQGDVAKASDVEEVISRLTQQMPRLGGIIHAAGIVDVGLLHNQNWEKFVKAMSPKILGTWNLHRSTQKLDLETFVMFSSLASMVSVPGQSSYAAVNAWMDGFASYRRSLGLSALSINWGAWQETGMAESIVKSDEHLEQGLGAMTNREGLEAFSLLVRGTAAQVGVLPINWQKFSQWMGTPDPYLNKLVTVFQPARAPVAATVAVSAKAPAVQSDLLTRINAAAEGDRLGVAQDFLKNEVAKILGLNVSEIELKKDLIALGLDSLLAVKFRNQIKKAVGEALGSKVPSTVIFKYPTIDALAKFLLAGVLPPAELASQARTAQHG